MRRKVSVSAVAALRRIQEQLGKFACAQPGEAAAVINLAECQAPVAIQTVPAQVGGLESFAPMDFTAYRKIASTCPISMSMLDASLAGSFLKLKLKLAFLKLRVHAAALLVFLP